MGKTDAMRNGGKILANILNQVALAVKPNATGIELDKLAYDLIRKNGGEPAFLGYQGYPATLCVSVNDEVVHGIPNDYKFKIGDVVSLDLGLKYQNFFTDHATTVIVTEGGAQTIINIMQKSSGSEKLSQNEKLLLATYQSMLAGIDVVKNGIKTGDVGCEIQTYAESKNFGVVRELIGHGVGEKVHQLPDIPNFGDKNTGVVLKTGDTIAVEPMLTTGGWQIKVDSNNWTVRTRDKSIAAHFEHTVLVTNGGFEILTA